MKCAVIIPCLNEAAAIAGVVREFRAQLPEASIYVLDNGSEDATSELAAKAGAQVIHSPQRGKGNVLRHAFRVINADFYIMIDGDGTYPVSEARRLLQIAESCNYEMVMGSRLQMGKATAFRPLHYTGNLIFTGLVRMLFGFPVQDLLTGYRVFSRRFAEEVHLISRGFEIETELTIRAMAQSLAFCEVPIAYGERVQGGKSKLRTFRDGFKILLTVLRFWAYFRPRLFFGSLALTAFAAAFLLPAGPAQFMAQAFTPIALALALTLDFFLLQKQIEPRHPSAKSNTVLPLDRDRRNSA